MPFINHNGQICLQDEAIIHLQNRALRYGEGLIETMYFEDKTIKLFAFHYERLEKSLAQLNFPEISRFDFDKEIAKTIVANQNPERGILRAQFFLNEARHELQFWIEYLPVQTKQFDRRAGIHIGFSKKAVKNHDSISHLKNTSRLNYVIAKREALEHNWDDILLINSKQNVVESTISNIFIIKDNVVYTPPLMDGCIEGVFRRFLLETQEIGDLTIQERCLLPSSIMTADEIFLTNAVRGIQPVSSLEGKAFPIHLSHKIFDYFAST